MVGRGLVQSVEQLSHGGVRVDARGSGRRGGKPPERGERSRIHIVRMPV